jgi:hypothetical protein
VGIGLACRGLHELHVEEVNTLIERNIRATRSSLNRGFRTYWGVLVSTSLGVALIVSSARSDLDNVLEFVAGAILALAGIIHVWKLFIDRKSKVESIHRGK